MSRTTVAKSRRERIEIRPQPGPQEAFLSSPADIVFYGGAAGGGKTYSMVLDPTRDVHVPGFGAVIFRRTTKQVMNEGGIWDEASGIYPYLGAAPSYMSWNFPSGATVSFGHLEHEKNKYDWQGAQICMIGFEELTHFTKSMFFYMFSRNRSTCGVRPRIRATMNPEKKSWVRKFIDWYIIPKGKPNAGTIDPARAGKVRYFIVENDVVIWKSRLEDFPEDKRADAKSFTFIPASIYDNKILMAKDPGYLANLKALPKVERDKLLGGNWDAEDARGEFFRKEWFKLVQVAPAAPVAVVRYWDRAASEADTADWTAGCLLAKYANGFFCILDMVRFRGTPAKVEERIKNTAAHDAVKYPNVMTIYLEQDPGQAGKMEVEYLIRQLAGYSAKKNPVSQAKTVRAGPASAQVEAGNVSVLEGPWNDEFFLESAAFPLGGHDDQVDAFTGAFAMITGNGTGTFTKQMAQSSIRTIAPSRRGKDRW